MCVGSLAGVTYLRYTVLTSSPDELQQERNSCPLFPGLLRSCFIGSCHVGVSKRFSRSISLAVFCLYTHFILAVQISCRSYVGCVYRMRSFVVIYSLRGHRRSIIQTNKHSEVLTYLTDDNKSSFRSGQSNVDLMLIGYKSQVLS